MGETKITLLYRDSYMDTISVVTGEVQSVLQITEGVTNHERVTAAVELPTDETAKTELLTKLAAELGYRIDAISPLEEPSLVPCVEIERREEASQGNVFRWRVAGDIHDGLTDEELRRCMQGLGLKFGLNNWMGDHLLQDQPIEGLSDIVIDPESGCFFAYVGRNANARRLAEYINGKSWIPAE